MQAAVLNQDRNSVISGREGKGDLAAHGGRFTAKPGLSPLAAAPHQRWMGKIARAVEGLAGKATDVRSDSAIGSHQLSKGWVTRAHFPNGGRISCEAGSLWITVDGGGEDIVLSSGEGRWFRPGAWVVIEAIANSEIIAES
jgi:hypothetical protein